MRQCGEDREARLVADEQVVPDVRRAANSAIPGTVVEP
jgi:hypothetical protein